MHFIQKIGTYVLCIVAAALVSSQASAQFADSACDDEYYKSLEARAWLEAQREITQNQNLITKPDSVLEYTCFDAHMRELADHASDMFSETTRWSGVTNTDGMKNALNSLVMTPASKYDTSNFNHNLLGGRVNPNNPTTSGWDPVTAPTEADNEAYTMDTSITGTDYACDIMQGVWMKAKCMDFIDNETYDGFFTFAEYVGNEKRHLPASCSQEVKWQDNIDKSTDEGADWEGDDVNTYLDILFPDDGCGDGSTSFIRTGLTVKSAKAEVGEYIEHACIVPGCYWEPSGSGGNGASTSGECKE